MFISRYFALGFGECKTLLKGVAKETIAVV